MGSSAITVALMMFGYIEFRKATNVIGFKTQDINTTTSADYSIKFDISKEFWNKFVALKGNPDHYMTMS
jgi:hypothetical protein